MSIGKGLAGTALQVAFKFPRFGLIGEGKVADQVPRAALDGRLILSSIVAGESRAKVVGEAGVVTAVVDRALQEVDVVYGLSSARRSRCDKSVEHLNYGGSCVSGG